MRTTHDREAAEETSWQGDPEDDESSIPRSLSPWAILAVATIVLPVITYIVIINDWAAPLTGNIYTEVQQEAAIDSARLAGFSSGEEQGYANGFRSGEEQGYTNGLEQGEEQGFKAGREDGYETGHEAGRSEGYSSGVGVGYDRGQDEGYDRGQDEGYEQGQYEGYAEGFLDGCEALFDGLETERVGDWWDYYYVPAYASYYERTACFVLRPWTFGFDS